MTKKKFIIALVLVVIIYFGILPLFWPSPTVKVDLAKEAPYNEDLEIKVVVSAWHSNFGISKVRFYVNPDDTTAHGPSGPFYPVVLYRNPQRRLHWSYLGLNRFTWPHSRLYKLTLPLKKLSEDGVVKPGLVKGKMDVNIDYASLPEPLALYLGFPSVTKGQRIPFELHLNP